MGGADSGDPIAIMEHEVGLWSKLWQANGTQRGRAALAALDALVKPTPMPEPIVGSMVIQAGKSFKEHTVAPDGFHPRSCGLLSVQAADALAALLNAVEWTG